MGPCRQVVVRAPKEAGKAAFFFLEEILGIIDQVLLRHSNKAQKDHFAFCLFPICNFVIFHFAITRCWWKCPPGCP